MAARFIIGVPVRAPNEAVLGDLGWDPFAVRAGWQVACLWCRVSRMPTDELLKKALLVQKRLWDERKRCWLQNVENTITQTDVGRRLWREWLESGPSLECTCAVRGMEVEGKVTETPWEVMIKEALTKKTRHEWVDAITRPQGSSGVGGNKLRTYATFKAFEPYSMEPYLWCVNDRRKRRLLARFRMGIEPLRVETGRYEANGKQDGSRGIPLDERICQQCGSGQVEDEVHFFMKCSRYVEIRDTLIKHVRNKEPALLFGLGFDVRACFRLLMSSCNEEVVRAVADFIWKAFMLREAGV